MSADHEVVHTPDSGLYKALYKHTATSKPNDIDLNIGDTCRIDSEDEEYVEIENKDWVYAHNLNTKMEGYVPRNYLVKISNSSWPLSSNDSFSNETISPTSNDSQPPPYKESFRAAGNPALNSQSLARAEEASISVITRDHLLQGHGLDLIAVGNPGSGKSTLWSSCSKQNFHSGPSYTGSGVTQDFRFIEDNRTHQGRKFNVRWGDTPGLNDPETAEKAAENITKAIQESKDKNRAVKLIFITNLNQGRISSEDLLTIKKIMSSVKLPDGEKIENNKFQVIINQINKNLLNRPDFDKIRFSHKRIFEASTGFSTDHFHYVEKFDELDYAENVRIPEGDILDDLLKTIFYEAPLIKNIEALAKMEVDDMQRDMEEMIMQQKLVEENLNRQMKEQQLEYERKLMEYAEIVKKYNKKKEKSSWCSVM